MYKRDETAFEPSTYKSNSSGKWPPSGPRLGERYSYKEKDIVSVNAAKGKNRATAGADTYSDLLIEELYKQNEMVLKSVVMLWPSFLRAMRRAAKTRAI